MSNRLGILAGIPILGFLGWLLWTQLIGPGDFGAWQRELLSDYQEIDPEAVSRYREGNIEMYPGFIYRLAPRDEAQRQRIENFWREKREERLEFDRNRLDSTQQRYMDRLAVMEKEWLDLPRQWWAMNLFQPLTGIQVELPLFLAYRHHISSPEDCKGYIYRLRELPARLSEALLETEKAAADGWVLDSTSLAETVKQIRIIAATPVKEQLLYRSFGTRITRLDPTVINEYQSLDFLIEAATELEENILPTLTILADRLEKLSPAPSLPENIFEILVQVRAGTMLDLNDVSAQIESRFRETTVNEALANTALALNHEEVLREITRSTAGILPQYPQQDARIRFYPQEYADLRPRLLKSTRDEALFPILMLSDSTDERELMLDIYQFGVPGAAWLQQLEVESNAAAWLMMADQSASEEGWGLTALGLLQSKLLWFSRDSLLLQAYEHRLARATTLAWLDISIHHKGLSPQTAQEQLAAKGWTTAPQLIEQVITSPGSFVAIWYWWQTWEAKAMSCPTLLPDCLNDFLR
ncbi:MAG: DUF885 family protein [Bacteroidia bacterium]|nr:DUF885 family protein [Bacteroidia bacterium]